MKTVDSENSLASPANTRAIAFYLPQFHRSPENNEWWGNGFTEWTNVVQARPAFAGHYQPHVPGDLGFYDASSDETILSQVMLAQKFGIYGFCFHYYWFAGKRVLTKPLETFCRLSHSFPFMICWANENWTRRWDGLDNDVLLPQSHDFANDVSFIDDVIPYLLDTRYLARQDGSKWLIVYRPSLMPNPVELFSVWREKALVYGIKLHISTVDGFGQLGRHDLGVDSFVQFPPLGFEASHTINKRMAFNPGYEAVSVYDYNQLRTAAVSSYAKAMTGMASASLVPGVAPGWDNSARKKGNASVVFGNNPSEFFQWVKDVCELQNAIASPCERFLFINAWNEWAEGAHLEPDVYFGNQFLAALNQGLLAADSCSAATNLAATLLSSASGDSKVTAFESSKDFAISKAGTAILRDLLRCGAINSFLGSFDISFFSLTAPTIVSRTAAAKQTLVDQLQSFVDQINGEPRADKKYYLFRQRGLNILGWLALPIPFQHKHPVFFCLRGGLGVRYWSISSRTYHRADVEQTLSTGDSRLHAIGYHLNAIIGDEIPSGSYELDAYIVTGDAGDLRSSLIDIHLVSVELI